MFESKEEYDELLKITPEGESSIEFKLALSNKRRQYKLHKFNLETGCMKFSSLHSFKGWEIHTAFLIINENESQHNQNEDDDFLNDQLVYTGITRARHNLNIINIGNKKYDTFLNAEIS